MSKIKDSIIPDEVVKKNFLRFPNDFMVQLSQKEFEILRSQSVTSRWEEEQIHMPLPNKVLPCIYTSPRNVTHK